MVHERASYFIAPSYDPRYRAINVHASRESMALPGKELYGVSVRRTLGGASWDSGTSGGSRDEFAKAEKLCLSLRAAK